MKHFNCSNKTQKFILLSSLALLSATTEAMDKSSMDMTLAELSVGSPTSGSNVGYLPNNCKEPELYGQDLKAKVVKGVQKDYAAAKLIVKNSGKIKSGPFLVYFNLEANVPQARIWAQQSHSVPNIAPGQFIVLTTNLIPSAKLLFQNNGYRVDVIVDAKSSVRECNEYNNKSTRNL